MAASLADAFAAVAGERLEHVCGLDGPSWHRALTEPEIARAFVGAPRDLYKGMAYPLARRSGRCLQDAEDAIQDELLELFVESRRVFRECPEAWAGRVYESARFRLRSAATPSTRSLDAVDADLVDKATEDEEFSRAPGRRSPISVVALPAAGERFSGAQMIEALHRFRDHHGRRPKARECVAANRLPTTAQIRREFASFRRLLLAAGMAEDCYRHHEGRWEAREVALACLSFKDRHGWWPSSGDIRRFPGELPSSSTMTRFFGSTRSCYVQRGAEAILGML
jgi:hypothetical protein